MEVIINNYLARGLLNLLLLFSVVGVVATGVLVDRLDLHEFRLHSLTGYAMTALVTIHVGLHWRSLFVFRPAPRRNHTVENAADPRRETDRTTDDHPGVPPTAAGSGHPRRAVLASFIAAATGGAAGWFARSGVEPNPYRGGDVGLFYHRESSMGLRNLAGNLLDWGSRPPRYKDIPSDHSVPLSTVAPLPVMTVAQALQQRRSRREFADRALTAEELGWMAHAATGITTDGGRRTAPSAGALYPIETYVAVNRVDGIEAGLYHVDVRAQALQPVRPGSVAGDLMLAGLGQDFLRTASVVFVLSGYFQRTRWKYHARHYRYVCWEAGHVAQNLYLAGEAAGLGVCVVGAFFDGTINDLLKVNGRDEAALGFIAVGPR